MPSRNAIAGIIAGFFLVTFAVYGLSLGNHFVAWDDDYLILSNPIIKSISWENTVNAFTSFDPELYDPLIFLVYQFNYMIGGLNGFMFHFTNLVLHTFNALGVCVVLGMLTGRRWGAIAGGLIFAVHPLNTEAVSWAAALKDVLSTFFFLLSIIAYLHYRKTKSHHALLYVLSLVAFLLGLLSKAMVLTLPIVLLLLDTLEHRKWTIRMFREKIPYFLLSIIFGLVALWGKSNSASSSTLAEKLLMAAKSTAFYLEKLVWPTGLSVLYPYSGSITITSPDFFIPVFLVLFIIGLIIFCWQRMRVISVGLLFYGLTLIPTFFNFAKGGYFYVASDRYAYIPQIGLLLIFLFLVDKYILGSTLRHRREYVFAGSTLIILVFSFLTMNQSFTWKNTETLFLQTLKHYPHAQAARINLGYVYRESKMMDKAMEQFNAVLAQEPDNAIAYANIGLLYERQGKTDEAIESYKKGMEANPRERDSFISLGMLYERQGKLDEAFELYKTVLAMNAYYAPVYNNLGSVYVQKNDLLQAKSAYEKAITINPYYADAYFNLAYIHVKEGNLTEAALKYEKTLEIEGEKVETLKTLTGIYAEQNRTKETIRTLERILAIDPTNDFATRLLNAIKTGGIQ